MNSKTIWTAMLAFAFMLNLHAQKADSFGIRLENYEYPYPVHFHQLGSQGQQLEMAYMYERAPLPNGKTVVLFHGKNFNGAYWRFVMADLLLEGFDVFVPDQIGFGKSSKPDHYQYSFHQLAHNTKQLIDSLGIDSTIVLGHSMGGMLATRFALMYPETTSKLILENPIGLEDWKVKVPYKTIGFWYQRELDKTYEGIKNYMLESYYDGQWKPKYDIWVELLYGVTQSPEYERYAWNAALTYDMIFTQPVLYEFEHLEMPTLLIIGQRDRTALGKGWVSDKVAATLGNYPALGEAAAEKIPDAELVELVGVGHLPHIEAYQKFWPPFLEFIQ